MTLAKIVFASMTGNTEEIADIVADKFRDLGVEVEVDECTTVDAEDFLEADIAVVATYTYGDGELPDEIVDFYEDLAGLDLNGKIYGVVGSGDTFYDEFCKAVDDFDRVFAATGAVKGSECVKVDLSAEDEDIEKLEAFAEEVVAKSKEASMELEKIRQEIDSIDKELVHLLEHRMHCVEDVIRYKETHQNPVLDRAREDEVLANVAGLVQEQRYEETILATYRDLMKRSRGFQADQLDVD